MIPKFKSFLILTFFALFVFTSCQDEVTEITNPTEEETIVANSQLATLIQNTSANDGSLDDILDNANCLSINLPVTIVVNDITITINTLEDLELIEDLFEEFNDDEDFLEFLFPITIILDDYTTIVIQNQEQLEDFIEECTDESEVIECVDFQYPISFSVFNSEFVIIDTVTINNDEELYEFLENLDNPNDANSIVSLNYPVTLEYANGETLEVNSNEELSEAISAAEDDCDDDEDECDLDIDEIEIILLECDIESSIYDGNDEIVDVNHLSFNENGEVIVNGTPAVTEVGTWQILDADEGFILNIEGLETFQRVNGNWLLEDCDDDYLEFVDGDNTLELEQECEDELECSAQEISMYLQECFWYAGTNLYNNVVAEEFYFGENGLVEVYNSITNELTTTGSWSVSLTDEGIFVTLDFDVEPLTLISLSWEVVECDDNRFELVNGDNYLVFERDCENDDYDCENLQANFGDDCEINGVVGFINENCECEVENVNPFECFVEDAELVECSGDTQGFAIFNLTEAFPECALPAIYGITYHESLADAEAGVNAISNPETYQNINTFEQTIYLAITDSTSQEIEVFEIHLVTEDCSNPSNCTEEEVDGFLLECTWNVISFNGSDDLIIFDFDFNDDGTVIISGDGVSITATWSTSQTANGVIVEFQNVNAGNIQAITGNWLVVECEEGRLELVKENDEMVLERDCN